MACFFSEKKLVWDQFLFHGLLRFVVIQDMTDLEIIAESPCLPTAVYVFIDCTAKKKEGKIGTPFSNYCNLFAELLRNRGFI